MKPEDFGLRSVEEMYFRLWLEDLKREGFVIDYDYENKDWELSPKYTSVVEERLKTKVKRNERTLIQAHSYGCDFTIYWSDKARYYFFEILFETQMNKNVPFFAHYHSYMGKEDIVSYVEVKPQFDQNNMEREFRINQKWVLDAWGDYVNLIKPVGSSTCLFAKTFTPDRYKLTDSSLKPRKIKHATKTLLEYLKVVEIQAQKGRWYADKLRGQI